MFTCGLPACPTPARSARACARALPCIAAGPAPRDARSASPSSCSAMRARGKPPKHAGFLVFRQEDDALVGVYNFSEIVRGAFQSAFLGYFAFSPLAGQGLMTEGLAAALDIAFRKLKLHRVEVNIQPSNARSLALATRTGLHARRLFPPLCEDQRPLARPRPVRDACRRLAHAAPAAPLCAQRISR